MSAGPPPRGERERTALVLAILAAHFAPPFLFAGVAVALPALGTGLHASAAELGLVETVFLAGSLAGLLPAGRLARACDRHALFRLGLAVFAASSLAIAAVPWLPALLVLRAVQGLASAVFAVTAPAILAEIVPPGRLGRVFGASLGVVYAGLTLGPLVAGWLLWLAGWRAVFAAGGALLLAAWLLVVRLLPARWRRPDELPHGGSTALLAGSALGLVAGSARLHAGVLGAALVAAGLLLAAAFVWWQPRLRAPLLDLHLLRAEPALRRALSVQMLLYANAQPAVFLASLFVQTGLGRAATVAGNVLAAGTVVMAAFAPLAGRLADRIGPRVLVPCGIAAVLASMAVATTFTASTGLAAVVAMLALHGLGFGLFAAPNMAAIMNTAGRERADAASALAAMVRSTGMVGGMLLCSALLALEFGERRIDADPERLRATVAHAYVWLAATAAATLALSLAPVRRGAKRP